MAPLPNAFSRSTLNAFTESGAKARGEPPPTPVGTSGVLIGGNFTNAGGNHLVLYDPVTNTYDNALADNFWVGNGVESMVHNPNTNTLYWAGNGRVLELVSASPLDWDRIGFASGTFPTPFSLAYFNNDLVLAGGQAGTFAGLSSGQLWVYDGTTWSQPIPDPPGYFGASRTSLSLQGAKAFTAGGQPRLLVWGVEVEDLGPDNVTDMFVVAVWDGTTWANVHDHYTVQVEADTTHVDEAVADAADGVVWFGLPDYAQTNTPGDNNANRVQRWDLATNSVDGLSVIEPVGAPFGTVLTEPSNSERHQALILNGASLAIAGRWPSWTDFNEPPPLIGPTTATSYVTQLAALANTATQVNAIGGPDNLPLTQLMCALDGVLYSAQGSASAWSQPGGAAVDAGASRLMAKYNAGAWATLPAFSVGASIGALLALDNVTL